MFVRRAASLIPTQCETNTLPSSVATRVDGEQDPYAGRVFVFRGKRGD
jgi:hypothetical protein